MSDSVPNEWSVVEFDSFTTLQRGKDLTKAEFRYGTVPVAGSNGVIGYHDTAIAKAPGITVGRSGSAGKVTVYDEDFWPHNTSLYVRDFHGNDPYFAGFLLGSLNLARFKTGASVPTLDRNSFKTLPILVPPFDEQKKIAHILSTVQRAIEAQERIIQATTELKKALMHKLFTEGLRNEPQKQTEIGPVPESWEVVPLGKYARVLNGYAFKSADYMREGVRLIRISNVSTGFLIDKDDKYLPTYYLKERSAYALKAGDLILSLTRPIIKEGMKYCFIEEQHLPALLNQRVGRFEITDARLRKDYLFQIIFSPYFIAPLKYMAEGSNQPNVSPTRLEAFQIPIPTDKEEQEQIAKLLTGLNRKMELAKQKASQLQDLFRTLLHELMTAKTRVHDFPPTA